MTLIVAPFKNRARITSRGRAIDGRAFPSIGDGTIEGGLLAWNTLVSAKPVFAGPGVQICVDVERGIYYKGNQNGQLGGVLYDDPNAVPGLQNEATGPARPFIGASGKFERALHNTSALVDMSGSTVNATGAGGYGTITLPAVGDWAGGFADATPLPVGATLTRTMSVTIPVGETVTLRVEDVGANEGTSVVVTGTGDAQEITATHTFTTARASGGRSYLWRNTGQTCDGLTVHRSWQYRVGDFPMQNLGGFTLDTLPEHMSEVWGIGLEYDPDTGKPMALVTGGEYAQVFADEDDALWRDGAVSQGITSDLLSSYRDSDGALVRRYHVHGTLASTSAGGLIVEGSTRFATPINSFVTSGLLVRAVSGDVPSGGFGAGLYSETAPSTFLGGSSAGVAVTVGGGWTQCGQTRQQTEAGTDQSRTDIRIVGSVSEAIDCIVEFKHLQLHLGATRQPYFPVPAGGQTVHAAQKLEIDANMFAPLGPDVYSAMGQSGAVGSSGSPWESSTDEGRFSVAGNVLTLSTGSAAETVSLLAAPLGLEDGDVVEVDLTTVRDVGALNIRDGAGTFITGYNINKPTGRMVEQVTVANGLVVKLEAPSTTEEAEFTINAVKQVQSGEATLFVDRTVGQLGLTQYALGLNRDVVSASERFLEFRQTGSNAVQANTAIASSGDDLTLDPAVAIGDRQKLVASRAALEVTGKAEGVTAPAANAVGAVDDYARLRIGTNGWSGGDHDAGRIHAFAVFGRVLNPDEQAELVE